MPPLTIVGGERERVGLWMLQRLPEVTHLPGGYEAIGVARGDSLVGGVLYSDYSPCPGGGDIRIWAVGGEGWLSRRTITVLLGYPFNRLNCHRLTAITAKKNKPSRTLLEDLGFRLEGMARQGYGVGKDAAIYGLLRQDQKWV